MPVLFVGNKVFLWLYLKFANGGTLPPMNWQVTGSGVNGGAQNCLMILHGIEVAMLRQPEAFKIPFTLAAYGYSRQTAYGESQPGEGSDGNEMAAALCNYGTVAVGDDPDVPTPTFCGPAFVYDRATELKWSGVSRHPAGIAERCKKHRLKSVPVTSADAAEAQLRRGRPLTWAGVWGGRVRCPL